MGATSWFVAGLLAGAVVTLGAMLLGRLARETTLGNRKVLLAGGLTTAGIAAVAAGMSLAISSGPTAVAAPDDLAMTARPEATSAPAGTPVSAAMPPASMMSQILSRPGGANARTAAPMDQAAAELATRLERGGGSAADWNLLAQAYDFLGRPEDARRARARAAQAGAMQAAR